MVLINSSENVRSYLESWSDLSFQARQISGRGTDFEETEFIFTSEEEFRVMTPIWIYPDEIIVDTIPYEERHVSISNKNDSDPVFYTMAQGFRRVFDSDIRVGGWYDIKVIREDFDEEEYVECEKCSEGGFNPVEDTHGNKYCSMDCLNEAKYGF